MRLPSRLVPLETLGEEDRRELSEWLPGPPATPPSFTTETLRTPPIPRRLNGRRLVVAAGLVAMLLGGGAFLLRPEARTQGPSRRTAPPVATAPAQVETVEDAPPIPQAAAPTPVAVAVAPEPVPEPEYAIYVVTDPPGAHVFTGARSRGATPVRVGLGTLDRSVELRILRPGYEAVRTTLRRDQGWRLREGVRERFLRRSLVPAAAPLALEPQ